MKQALVQHDPKRLITPVVNRTLHTYSSVLRILCQAFQIDVEGRDFGCERRLIEEAHRIHHAGKMLAPIIDDAHLIDVRDLRRLRLLFEDFPKDHNLVLIAQPKLLTKLALTPNEDLRSRVTYSVLLPKLAPERGAAVGRAYGERERIRGEHRMREPCAIELGADERGDVGAISASAPARGGPRPHQDRRPQAGQPRPASAPLEGEPDAA